MAARWAPCFAARIAAPSGSGWCARRKAFFSTCAARAASSCSHRHNRTIMLRPKSNLIAILGSRIHQAFPDLLPEEIERLRRFGTMKRYAGGERLFAAGKPRGGMFIILAGEVEVSQRDGLGHITPVLEQGPGQFLAEVGTLSDRPSFVDGHAKGNVEAVLIPSAGLRALLIAEAELGER